MPITKYTEETPGVTPEHLAYLERKRERWKRNYESFKKDEDQAKAEEFLAKYPEWESLKTKLPEQWREVIERYHGLGGRLRQTTTQIGEDMPIKGKPRTRQAIHLILGKGLGYLNELSTLISETLDD